MDAGAVVNESRDLINERSNRNAERWGEGEARGVVWSQVVYSVCKKMKLVPKTSGGFHVKNKSVKNVLNYRPRKRPRNKVARRQQQTGIL